MKVEPDQGLGMEKKGQAERIGAGRQSCRPADSGVEGAGFREGSRQKDAELSLQPSEVNTLRDRGVLLGGSGCTRLELRDVFRKVSSWWLRPQARMDVSRENGGGPGSPRLGTWEEKGVGRETLSLFGAQMSVRGL